MMHPFLYSFRELSARPDAIRAPGDVARYGEERIQTALGRFSHRVRQVAVTLRDLNGPRGGVDKECRVRMSVEPAERIVVKARADSAHAAIAAAARRAGTALRRRLLRRRCLARSRFATQL